MSLVRKARSALGEVGPLGVPRSAYHSLRHTGDPTSLLFDPSTTVSIAPETTFDVEGTLCVGVGEYTGVSGSVFRTTPGSTVAHRGDGRASIGPGSFVKIEGEFSMGDSYINYDANVRCRDRIEIGDGCALAWNLQLMDGDGHRLVVDGEPSPTTAPVVIEDDVWIGHSVTVGKGVTVGAGSVVASNSVCLSDVPPGTLVAGSPASVVRENVTWQP